MQSRKGILLVGGLGTRLHPLTKTVSKQLLPLYDKPLVYYPLSVLMLAGIREILIISTPRDLPLFEILLEDGSGFGIELHYAEQEKPEGLAQAIILAEKFIANSPSCLILGDNFFYGHGLTEVLGRANQREEATIFAYQCANPSKYGIVEFDGAGKAISIEEKPAVPKSNNAVPGIYFYEKDVCEIARSLKPSERGELEITDLNLRLLKEGRLHVETLGRGIAWMDTGTPDDLLAAANFVHAVQSRQGLQIACLEEIAWRKGWISDQVLSEQADAMGLTSYSTYLKGLLA